MKTSNVSHTRKSTASIGVWGLVAFGTRLRNTEVFATNLMLYLLHVQGIRNMYLQDFPMIQSILDSFRLKLFHYHRKTFEFLKKHEVSLNGGHFADIFGLRRSTSSKGLFKTSFVFFFTKSL